MAMDLTKKDPIGTGAMAGAAEKGPAAALRFEELPQAEQIRRLRMEVLLTRELVNSQQALIERLMSHEHKADGSMVVPMGRSGQFSAGNLASSRRDPLA